MKDVRELIEWTERAFICSYGPPRAYFDFPISRDETERFTYVTLAARTRKVEDVEGRLVRVLANELLPFAHKDRLLMWRYTERVEFEAQEVQLVGECLLTQEQHQDGAAIPPGAVQSWDSMNWYEDKGKTKEYTIYTRVVIPQMLFSGESFGQFNKPQGSVALLLEELK